MSQPTEVAPPPLLASILTLSREAEERYGQPMVRVVPVHGGVRGFVAVSSQAARLREVVAAEWPGATVRVLILANRRARVRVSASESPLEIWRRPPGMGRELTTELLPGDPPAEVVAFRGQHLLVRAPGSAIGWVARPASWSLGAVSSEGSEVRPAPLAADSPNLSWSSDRVIAAALLQQGRPYVWGGTGGAGVDCSGLLWRAFLSDGVLLPRNSRAQRMLGARVRPAQLQPGDLVGAVSRGPRRTSHVALCLSAGEVIHACSEQGVVRREGLADFELRYRLLTLRRLPGNQRPDR